MIQGMYLIRFETWTEYDLLVSESYFWFAQIKRCNTPSPPSWMIDSLKIINWVWFIWFWFAHIKRRIGIMISNPDSNSGKSNAPPGVLLCFTKVRQVYMLCICFKKSNMFLRVFYWCSAILFLRLSLTHHAMINCGDSENPLSSMDLFQWLTYFGDPKNYVNIFQKQCFKRFLFVEVYTKLYCLCVGLTRISSCL